MRSLRVPRRHVGFGGAGVAFIRHLDLLRRAMCREPEPDHTGICYGHTADVDVDDRPDESCGPIAGFGFQVPVTTESWMRTARGRIAPGMGFVRFMTRRRPVRSGDAIVAERKRGSKWL